MVGSEGRIVDEFHSGCDPGLQGLVRGQGLEVGSPLQGHF